MLHEPTSLPTIRPAGCPFAPPTGLAQLREERPLVRMRYPDGHQGWLATSYALVRTVLADSRFSSRYELMHYPVPGVGELPPAPAGDMTGMDAPEHTRYRRLLAGKFTAHRMKLLTERVEQITTEHLDAMERQNKKVDLFEAFAHPVPAHIICELLGVPYADRDTFHRHTVTLMSLEATREQQIDAMAGLQEYMAHLVTAKQTEPTDDLLSDLTTSGLTSEELTGIGALLLSGGLDTTANMIAYGAFALLQHPHQLAAFRSDPDLADQAIEELMRFLSIAHTSVRVALEDIELDGQTVRAGECVTLSIQAANRDPDKFPDPDFLDLYRKATGHLGFGHGIHQCLGQQLARVEMRVALPALFKRFPKLRLAIPAEKVPLRTDMNIYGVHRLPVTWAEV
ncbi:cytochrome P450 [Streptomyces milbemycinicus]|uniref:cytochrome P450 n=1 Tax=Streptomyces milbemycinicus TaxID=476552 RepID=UPI003401BD3A